MLMANQLLLRN